jgi:hypothetical protein
MSDDVAHRVIHNEHIAAHARAKLAEKGVKIRRQRFDEALQTRRRIASGY